MKRVWVSAILRDGAKPSVRGILCDNGGNVLFFDTPLNALNFWREHKSRFAVPPQFDKNNRFTPRILRDDDDLDSAMEDIIKDQERIRIKPVEGHVLYSKTEINPEWM